ncbi:class I SAM-dependent rRNA methyltransferase [Pseudanabaena mucicola]|uniref:Class I SAM-dependent rRNA methyltransferase n=1 Tax=Pseudanabaena mucicola FACHB-723 TaxID=2692860 RepID=A0ABR7ZSA7_9CYAN|nr:class I SAM-dependent rRNA methyltransferase [Pseudanabaena mucicola]MBD2186848.1 class I SAM-dependent rRNA methyltransferase [Pseudanabaena mucicola FACHB-723]
MSTLPRAIIHRKKVDAVQRFHPWIFSGAIAKMQGEVQDGDLVEAYSEDGKFLAIGLWGMGSIAIKVLSFQPIESMQSLIRDRILQAFMLRQQLGLMDNAETNCYRLINSEGDGLAGLIIDVYGDTAVLQCHSLGTYRYRQDIAATLKDVYGDRLLAVYDKSSATLSRKSQAQSQDGLLLGEKSDDYAEVLEYGHRFIVDWEKGQKTGFFLDQRENRQLFGKYAAGKKVLNTFCYSGGFSVYAVASGAKEVHSIDSSAKAMEWTDRNIAANFDQARQAIHTSFTGDVFDFLKQCDRDYDAIVLDPPAFAKSLSARHSAMQAYRRLNLQAMSKLKSGGLLFTFSCSQVVNVENFTGAVTAAAIESGRNIKVLHHLTHPADHPTSIFHPEGAYLKGLVLSVV